MTTDLIIVGAGAGGLMAAAAAGEAGLRCLLVERRHRPGLKLLMCGNNRCNLSHAGTLEELLRAYGPGIGEFLRPALEGFSPADLRAWFRERSLATAVLNDRIYPRSEKADDVLHAFTDALRNLEVPVLYNTPVRTVRRDGGSLALDCGKLALQGRCVLLATGGLSYPKTGSVGDGQRIAAALGHALEECRPGLAGIRIAGPLPCVRPSPDGRPVSLPEVRIQVVAGGRRLGTTSGNLLVDRLELRGSAVFDAVRIVSRERCEEFTFSIEGLVPGRRREPVDLELSRQSIRPLKEAVLTMGGVSRSEIDPRTMESVRVPGLYFAGELIDVDGPTGGYNLHAAFATARLAVKAISSALKGQTPTNPDPTHDRIRSSWAGAARTPRPDRKHAWGRDLWNFPRTGRRPQ